MKNVIEKSLEKTKQKIEKYYNVYHRTNIHPDIIKKSGFLRPKEDEKVFVSNRKKGQAEGYGKHIIPIKAKKHELSLEDEFPNGEKHYSIHYKVANSALKR